MNRKGLRVRALDAKVAEETGIRPGDRIRRVNGHPIEDELDYRFHAAGEEGVTVEVQGCEGGEISGICGFPAKTFSVSISSRCGPDDAGIGASSVSWTRCRMVFEGPCT